MRQILLTLTLWLAPAHAVLAIECLNGQSSDILAIESWELRDGAGPDDERAIAITLELQGDLGIRLIDGTIRFEDVLGDRVAEFILERAEGIVPGQPYIHDEIIAGTVLERLEQLHPDDIASIACVSALVYEDGTLQEFRQ
ncbi:hypothetical protein [Pelagibacterium mangrovi]|uniref:hypothetical protein n=1 Tax=Pelagibacterium mangrovi TaxID=3119828 RepID=UPI002FCA5D68